LESKLYEEVEGTCSGRYGYIIAVIDILSIGNGMLLPTSGYAEFKLKYKAIVFKPFKNQVLDGIVTTVNKVSYYFLLFISYSLYHFVYIYWGEKRYEEKYTTQMMLKLFFFPYLLISSFSFIC